MPMDIGNIRRIQMPDGELKRKGMVKTRLRLKQVGSEERKRNRRFTTGLAINYTWSLMLSMNYRWPLF